MPAATIVVVDDDEPQRYATRRTLEAGGYQVQEASTGAAALALAKRGPALVVLDVNLPDINGFEVCRRIKMDEATRHVAVLHLSAHRITTAAKVTGLESGADAYLTQPVEREELLATVATLLRAQSAELALRESEESYRLLFESHPVPCWVFDSDTLEILAVNQAAVSHFGFTETEFLSRSAADLRPPAVPVPERSAPGGDAMTFRSQLQKKDGSRFDAEITWQAMRFRNRDTTLAVVYDLAERQRAEEAARNAELRRQLLDRVLEAQEQERRSIARELHDETGQLITSLLVNLRALEEAKKLSEAKALARELRQIATRAIDDVGRIARGLHPTVLEDLGLRAALVRLVAGWAKAGACKITLHAEDHADARLSFPQRIGVYRIVQEALTNAHKHARAKHVTIDIGLRDTAVAIQICDDGVGFSPQQVPGRGIGLQSMRERARSLGGDLEVTSGPQGTVVRARIPLPKEP